jgi:rubrerythrin
MQGRHATRKLKSDPTYNAQWSGVSYASHCSNGCRCQSCGTELHMEEGNHYCPHCDSYVSGFDKNGKRCYGE